MNAGTAIGIGLGGLAAAEATGATNLLGPDRETPETPQLPGNDGPSMDAILSAVTAAAETGESGGGPDAGSIAQAVASAAQSGQSGGVSEGVLAALDQARSGGNSEALTQALAQNQSLVQELQRRREQAEDATPDTPEWLQNLNPEDESGGSDDGKPTDDADDGYDIQEDYDGYGSEYVRLLAEGGARSGDVAESGDSFISENPYFTAGTAAGAVSPDPVTTALGATVGGTAEVSADFLTGNTPLGVQSPVDVTNEDAMWQGSDPLNLGSDDSTLGIEGSSNTDNSGGVSGVLGDGNTAFERDDDGGGGGGGDVDAATDVSVSDVQDTLMGGGSSDSESSDSESSGERFERKDSTALERILQP